MAAPEALDLDPIEPEDGARPPAKSARPVGKPKPPRPADDEDEPRPRKSVAGNRKVPYPPSPTNVPEGLTDYPESFKRQQQLLLAGLILFLTFYVGALLFCALIGVWCLWSFNHYPVLKVVGLVVSGFTFLFLVKGFFKRHPMDKEMHIEITEKEQPVLFEFIYRLCDELDAPLPNRVFVSPDVNAAVIQRVSMVNLFVEPKRDLLIGLGRVNCSNLTEFKSVLAHEFGHFSHLGRTSSYAPIVLQIIIDLITGEDWLDRSLNWCKQQQNVLALVGYGIGGPLWLGRTVLWWVFKAIALQEMAVRREQEFHADLVAVKAAGSDAVPFRLARARFGMQCFMQAISDMAVALDHKLYSDDMFLHQDRAAAIVRQKKKDPQLGIPPALDHPLAGKSLRVFDSAEEDPVDDVPEMERSHPPDHEREENAKERFVPAVIDNRSPWILFENAAELKERMTYKFYRMVFKIPKNAELVDALKVQKFIDNEHADTTYDPKYKGSYDDRPLEPGELSELDDIIKNSPWNEERMEKVYDKLYDGCEEHAEAHSELYKEMQALRNNIVGRPSPKMKRKMEEIEKKQDENWEWFKSFDRRVYLLHVQMAAQVDKHAKNELIERYRFQLEVQRLYQESRDAFNKADMYLGAYAAASRGEIQLPPDFPGEVIQVLRGSWKALKNIIKDAREINLPAMKNFEEGDNLAEFILEGKMVPEPPLSYVKGMWIDKLMTQLQGVRQKCFRLHFKSVGGILKLQEEIAAKWKAQREPVAAEVIEPEPIPAEVVPADVIPADVIPADIIPADVVPAEVVEADIIPADVVPAEVVEADIIPADIVPAEVVAEEPHPNETIAAQVIPAQAMPAEEPPTPDPEPIPAPVVAAAPLPSEPAAPLAFRSAVPLTALPEPVLEPEPPAPREPEPEPTPVATEPVTEAPPPAPAEVEPEPVAAEVVEAEVVDFVEAEIVEPEPASPPRPALLDINASTTFSLDSGLPLPAKPKPFAPAAPAPPVAAEEVFSLDEEPVDAIVLDAGHESGPKSGSARRPASVVLTKPANGKRPALKITMVKPDEASPLAE